MRRALTMLFFALLPAPVVAQVIDTQAPSIPTGLVATAVSPSQIDLKWNPSTDNVRVTGYWLYVNGGNLTQTSATSFSHTGLTAGTTYSYRVSAFDAAGNDSPWTATPVAVATLLAMPFPPVQPQVLPTNITVELRLRGIATATNAVPVVRVVKPLVMMTDDPQFKVVQPCWNTVSPCPKVVAASVRFYLNGVNVTQALACKASECMLPDFAPMTAKPGEGYRFFYDRVRATWVEPPNVVSDTQAPSVPTGLNVTPGP